MPIFIGITFAVIDYGMMMSNRSSAAGNISSLTRTIQDHPQISAAQLNTLVINAGGGSVNFTATGNCFCAQSFTTQAAAQTFVNGAGCGDAACGAGRNTLGGTPRYIGVRGQVTYNFITPVNKIFIGSNTKVLKFGQVVPVGITVCPVGQSLTSAGFCAASTVTCGAGQVLSSSNTCVNATATCGSGQVLSSSNTCVNATVTCGAGQFLTASGTCSAPVPVCNGAGQALQFNGANWSCRNQVISLDNCNWSGWSHNTQPWGAACPSGYVFTQIRVDSWPSGDGDGGQGVCCRMIVQ